MPLATYDWLCDMFANTDTLTTIDHHINAELDTALGNLAGFNAWRFLLSHQTVKILDHYRMPHDQFQTICHEIQQLSQINTNFDIHESSSHQIYASFPLPHIFDHHIWCHLSSLYQGQTFTYYQVSFNIRQTVTNTLLETPTLHISNTHDIEPIFYFT